jgi:hypothetical protein
MDGFRTARVLVLDDDPQQAMPVIHALGLLGISAIYHNGSIETRFPTKLTGVRVMFVDMVLAEHGADANDPKACVTMVTETLKELVEDSCDPIVVICWTGHGNMAEEFQPILKKTFPKSKIDNVIVADKSALSSPEDLEKLKELIAKAVAEHGPVNVLFRWEQMVHDAATRTTGAITQLIQQYKSDDVPWNQRGYQVCAALALAERGSRLAHESEAQAIKALFDSLNPLLNDRLDHDSTISGAGLQAEAKILLETVQAEHSQWDKGKKSENESQRRAEGVVFVQNTLSSEVPQAKLDALPPIPLEAISLLSSQLRAALNTMVHISTNVSESEIYPGNVLFLERKSENRKHIDEKYLIWQEVGEDTLFPYSKDEPRNHLPILMEFSASCDFAQEKSKLPRFVAGFLVPEEAEGTLRRTAYIKTLGPLLLSNPKEPQLDGVYHLIFNAHFLISVQRNIAVKAVSTFRLRTAVLAEFSNWISNHIGRPGALHVGP